MRQRKWEFSKKTLRLLLVLGVGMVAACWQNLGSTGDAPAAADIFQYLKNNLYLEAVAHTFPAASRDWPPDGETDPAEGFFQEHILSMVPLWQYADAQADYEVQTESGVTYEMLLARNGTGEPGREAEQDPQDEEIPSGKEEGQDGAEPAEPQPGEGQAAQPEAQPKPQPTDTPAMADVPSVSEPVAHVSRELLNDFDYLVKNYYIVDRTTTTDAAQLNAAELLAKDMRLTTGSDQPQILIHHTHSQERYADSTEDASTTVVGVGEYLTRLLREKYGFNVIHDTEAYDVIDHDNAYSYAGVGIEKILAENPSIQVIIDLHRDGISGDPLVQEVNGKRTAKIMFFNGLSRTIARGNLDYLYNPNLQDNLAFSLQMKIAAEEYYPGFTRPNFLKGYCYNLHYLPRSMLVEVGAQNNTVEEAMNAMEPLADLLHKVLVGTEP